MYNPFVRVILLQDWLGSPKGKEVYLSKFKAAEMSNRGICKIYEEDQKNESIDDLEKVNEENNPQGEETLVSKSVSKPQMDKMIKEPKIKK